MDKVKLIWITPEAEKVIAYCARVSNPKNQNNPNVAKLLNYCAREKHWSIFEMASMCVEINTTRAIATQILRHKSLCLGGDVKLYFELPNSTKRRKRSLYKRSIKDIYELWHNGQKPIPISHKLTWTMANILPDRLYSPAELAKEIGIAPENVRTLCQKNKLKHSKVNNLISILGQDVIDYYHSRENHIRLPYRKQIQKMRLRFYDLSSKTFSTTHIKNIWKSGIKSLFRVHTANGYYIDCTADHLLLTPAGYQSIGDALNVSVKNNKAIFDAEKEIFLACNGIPSYQDKEWLLSAKKTCIENQSGIEGIAELAGVSYHTIRKWLKIHNLQFSREEIAKITPIWNKGKTGYKNKPHSLETIQKMRNSAKRGADNFLWKGGVDRAERQKIADWCNSIRAELLKKANYSCSICSSSKNLELHHIKPVYSHPELAYEKDNLQVLCKNCHDKIHKINGDTKVWRERNKGNSLTIQWAKVTNIEYLGEQEVFDLEVENENHNFVANGIVVHNCFQQFSLRYSEAEELTIPEVRRQDTKNRQNSIDDLEPELKTWWEGEVKELYDRVETLYREALDRGIAKECARGILPLSTSARLYASGTIRSWIHYLQVRANPHSGTQKEHFEVACAIKAIFKEQMPEIYHATLEDLDV
jgi:thymidylate synthase (FAD)